MPQDNSKAGIEHRTSVEKIRVIREPATPVWPTRKDVLGMVFFAIPTTLTIFGLIILFGD